MKARAKKDVPVNEIRRFLEPGPIVLVSSAYNDETNIMTMGWHRGGSEWPGSQQTSPCC